MSAAAVLLPPLRDPGGPHSKKRSEDRHVCVRRMIRKTTSSSRCGFSLCRVTSSNFLCYCLVSFIKPCDGWILSPLSYQITFCFNELNKLSSAMSDGLLCFPPQNAVSNTRWFLALDHRPQTSETVRHDLAYQASCIRPRASGLYSSSSPHHLFLQKLTRKCSYGLLCPVFPKYPSIQPMIASTRPVASKHCRSLPWSSVQGSLY